MIKDNENPKKIPRVLLTEKKRNVNVLKNKDRTAQ